jgi:tetratricopeptide (TPR) repeat protein
MVVSSGVFPKPAAAADAPKTEDVNEARLRYKKGVDLYEDGAFDAALIEFQRAYDTAPSYKILYNIGLVNLQLNDYAGALRSFRKYLDEGGKKIDAKRRSEVEREIKKLESRVVTLTIKVNVDGAQVLIDDLEVGESPLESGLLVNAGKRKITVAKPAYTPITRVVVIAGGEERNFDFELRPNTSAPRPLETKPATELEKPKPRPKPEPARTTRPTPVIWWGATGVLAAAAATSGVLALRAQADFNDKKDHPATKAELDDAAKKTRTFAILSDIFLGGTLVVGGYATYLTFFKTSEDVRADQASIRFSVGPGRLRVDGRF